MINRIDVNPLLCARVVGLLYLMLLVVGPFSLIYVPGVIVETGNASVTVSNLIEHEFLFRLGLAGYSLTLIGDILIAVFLYVLFRPAGKVLSMVAFSGRLGTAFLHGVVLFVNILVLLLVSEHGNISLLGENQINALTLIFLNLNQNSGVVWGLFFAIHCLSIGILGFRSGFLPKIIGLMMIATGIGYVLYSFGMMLFPKSSILFTIIVGVGSLGELVFALWLLIKRVDLTAWNETAINRN